MKNRAAFFSKDISLILSNILISLFLITAIPVSLPAQSIENAGMWAEGTSSARIFDILHTGENRRLITGTFWGTANFGEFELVSHGFEDVFLIETDSTGRVLQAFSGGGPGKDFPQQILENNEGDIYLGGIFRGTAEFGSFSRSSQGGDDIFILKLNTALNPEWFFSGGCPYSDRLRYMHYSEQKEELYSYVYFYYGSTVVFGGVLAWDSHEINAAGIRISPEGSFLQLLNPNNNTPHFNYSAPGIFGNTGKSLNDRTVLFSSEYIDYGVYLAEQDTRTGVYANSKVLDDFGTLNSQHIAYRVMDASHYPTVYLAGRLYEILGREGMEISNQGEDETYDIFLCKYNIETDSLYWLKRIGGMRDDFAGALIADEEENLYLGGYYENTCSFGSGFQLSSNERSAFVASYDSLGTLRWAKTIGSGSDDMINGIELRSDGGIEVFGTFNESTSLGDTLLLNPSGKALFHARIGCKPAKPDKIIGDSLLCIDGSAHNYQINEIPSADYEWTLSGGGIINSDGGSAEILWQEAGEHILKVKPVNDCGEGPERILKIRVRGLPSEPVLSGDTLACTGTEAYSVPSENGTDFIWSVNSGGTVFGIDHTAVVNWTQPGNYLLKVETLNVCGTGPALLREIRVSAVPEQPSALSGDDRVCAGSSSYSVSPNATAELNWTLSDGGQLSFSDNHAQVLWEDAGTHRLSVTPSNRCGSGPPRSLDVEVETVPENIGSVSGNRSVCTGTEEYGVMQESGTEYAWTLSGGGLLSANGNTAEVYWQTPGNYTLGITASNHCGIGTSKSVNIIVNDIPSQIPFISGLETVCKGTQNYQVPEEESVNYNWTLSGGGSLNPNDYQAQVNWETPGTFSLTAVPYNTCGTGASRSLSVTVSDSEALTSGITGNSPVCLGSETYTAEHHAGMSYDWQLSGGGILNQTDNTATVSWENTGLHTLSVSTSDGCAQALSVEVKDLPGQPDEIIGETEVCKGESIYQTTALPDRNYIWELDGGGTLSSFDHYANVNWTEAGFHQISLKASNMCGEGPERSTEITVNDIPPQAGAIAAEDTACLTSENYSVNPVPGVEYHWSLENAGGVLIPSDENAEVVWLYPHDNTIYLSLGNNCGTGPVQSKNITISDIPDIPQISGEKELCLGEDSEYTTNLKNGHQYHWSLASGGNLTVRNDTAVVEWTESGEHLLSLSVSNRCGTSSVASILTEVKDIPGMPANISGDDEVCLGTQSYQTAEEAGITYHWQLSGGGSLSYVGASAVVNWDTEGIYTLSVGGENRCGEGPSAEKAVSVFGIPERPSLISGEDSVCLGYSTYSVTEEPHTDYIWTLPQGGELTPGGANANVDWTDKGMHTLSVRASNFCGNGLTRSLDVYVNKIPENAVFSLSETEVCLGESNYTVNDLPGASYLWSVSGGGSISSASTDNTASVNWTQTGEHQISVSSFNECGTSNPTVLSVRVGDVPAQAAIISGDDNLCIESSVYTTDLQADVSYLWTLNGGGALSPNHNTALVNWQNAGDYQLTVTPYNECGNGSSQNLTVSVNDIPSQPGLISGNANPCIASQETYTVPENAELDYHWELLGGDFEQNGNEILAEWNEAGSGQIRVRAENMCGSSSVREMNVSVKNIPETTYFTHFDEDVCLAESFYVVYGQSGTSYDWSLSSGGELTASGNNATILWNETGEHQISVSSFNECGTSNPTVLSVSVGDVPEIPHFVSGEDSVCTESVFYSVNPEPIAEYSWTLTGGGALNAFDNNALVNWQLPGVYELGVSAYNECGSSDAESMTIYAETLPQESVNISGELTACVGQSGLYMSSGNTIYEEIWSLDGGGILSAEEDTAHIDWISAGNYTLALSLSNRCGVGSSAALNIRVSEAVPHISERINGKDTVCIYSSEYYAVDENQTYDYSWIIDTGAYIQQTLNSAVVEWTESGEHYLSVYADNHCGKSDTAVLSVWVENPPRQPEIILRNDSLFSSAKYGNIWYYEGLPIQNAENDYYNPNREGVYSLRHENSCGFSSFSKSLYISDMQYKPFGVKVYPNPVIGEKLTIELPANLTAGALRVEDSSGRIVAEQAASEELIRTLNTRNFSSGMYFLKIETEAGELLFKFIKK